MKLTDLNPHWYTIEEGGPIVGLTFECPTDNTKRIGVPFYGRARVAMVDGGDLILADEPGAWSTDGKGFDEMTLTPEINAAGWRGTVEKGDIVGEQL